MRELLLHRNDFNESKVQTEMEKHALSAPDREVCGFVYCDKYIPLTNRSLNSYRFEADPGEVAAALAKHGEPQSIFHTHPNGSLEISDTDRSNAYYPHSTILIGVVVNGRLKLS